MTNERRTIGACVVLIGFVIMLVLYFIDEKITKKKQEKEESRENKAADKADASGWISVDEKLPDCSHCYLTQVNGGREFGLNLDKLIVYYRKEDNTWLYENGYENKVYDVSEYVIAWQPLPEQYRGWR